MTNIKDNCKIISEITIFGFTKEYFIFNGKREGICKLYKKNIQEISEIHNYINNKKEGVCELYTTKDRLKAIYTYKNDKKEGEYKEYNNNRQLVKNIKILKYIY